MDYDAVTFSFSPSVDSISQFKVETSTSSAGNGGAAGAQISLVTKSGTNNLHGTLWEFNRNNAFTQTYDAIAKADAPSPRLNRNLYGANIGGPIYIPHLYNGHGQELLLLQLGVRDRGQRHLADTPYSSHHRRGDQRKLRRSEEHLWCSHHSQEIPSLACLSPTIRSIRSLFSPQSLIFLKYTPVVTGAINSTNNYSTPVFSGTSTQNDFTFRIDHNIGTKDNLVLLLHLEQHLQRWRAGVRSRRRQQPRDDSQLQRHGDSCLQFVRRQLLRVRLPHLQRGGDLRHHRQPSLQHRHPDGHPLCPERASLLRATRPSPSAAPTESLAPTISSGRSVLGTVPTVIGTGATMSAGSSSAICLISAATSSTATSPSTRYAILAGSFTFNGQYTGSALVDFLLGYIQNDSSNPTHTSTNLYDIYPALYLQDNYKMTRNLTLNLGIRWDYFPALHSEERSLRGHLPERQRCDHRRHTAGGLALRSRPDPEQLERRRSADRLRVVTLSDHGRPRRLRHLLHHGDFQRILRHG